MDKKRLGRQHALRRLRRGILVLATAAVLSLGTVGAAAAQTATNATNTQSMTNVTDVYLGSMQSVQVQPFGNCTFAPPDPAWYLLFQTKISSCENCLDVGQIGEDEGLWENFLCFWAGEPNLWELYTLEGPQSA